MLPLSKTLLAGLGIVAISGIVVFIVATNGSDGPVSEERVATTELRQTANPTTVSDPSTPKATPKPTQPTIKHIGINLDVYDAKTNMAGDLKFTKARFGDGKTMQLLFSEFGYEIPGNSATGGVAKKNVQPTFIAPLGTKVHSLVDGVVVNIPKLYSNDYSVMVQAEGSNLIFETEHVENVVVKVGDKVTAGQVVAEVSSYDARNYGGLGLFEIGILDGGNGGLPNHLCPFNYLDASIKDDVFAKITDLKKSWEMYRGDTSLYDESKAVIPGCLTLDPIAG